MTGKNIWRLCKTYGRLIGQPQLKPHATHQEIAEALRMARHTRYPVSGRDLDNIVGTVHVKDLLRRLLTAEPLRVDEVRQVPFVPETATLDVVLDVIRRRLSEMVIDGEGRVRAPGTARLDEVSERFGPGPARGSRTGPDDHSALMLLDLPGKRRLERRIVGRP
jgi:hypothetical protein